MRQPLILAALMGAFAAPAWAESAAPVPPEVCTTQSNTLEMVECADWHFRQADATLQTAIALVRERYPTALPAFEQAQMDWEVYSRSYCDYQAYPYDSAPGSIFPLMVIDCLTIETLRRAAELTALAEREA